VAHLCFWGHALSHVTWGHGDACGGHGVKGSCFTRGPISRHFPEFALRNCPVKPHGCCSRHECRADYLSSDMIHRTITIATKNQGRGKHKGSANIALLIWSLCSAEHPPCANKSILSSSRLWVISIWLPSGQPGDIYGTHSQQQDRMIMARANLLDAAVVNELANRLAVLGLKRGDCKFQNDEAGKNCVIAILRRSGKSLNVYAYIAGYFGKPRPAAPSAPVTTPERSRLISSACSRLTRLGV
jgi:hypothetical protein